jgi:hypothetical protein
MKVAFGLKPHSGWAALVVVGRKNKEFVIIDRQRMTFADEPWMKAPYHAAEELQPLEARELVLRGIDAAHRNAIRELRAAIHRERERANQVTGVAVLTANAAMPDWSIDEILAVHFRMHKAEGILFREALVKACAACDIRSVAIPEKLLTKFAKQALGGSEQDLAERLSVLGKSVGPPWGKDQKDATLAAMSALAQQEFQV